MKSSILHIGLIILMYGLYVYLWLLTSISNNRNMHYTDSALGVAIMFIFSIPIYFLIHVFFIWRSKKKGLKKILIIHLTGVTLLIIQIATFLFKTNFLS